MKVLMCSPEKDHLHLLQTMFSLDGWHVITCAGLAEAADLTISEPPDAIIVDPYQDGSLAYLRQVMNVFWEYRLVVAFMTTRMTASEVDELAIFKPDMVVNLPRDLTTALPRRIQELVANQATAEARAQTGPTRAVTY